MFIDTADSDGVRNNTKAGLWALREDTDQYRAWKMWLHAEFGKTFFPRWLTVWSRWPPTTRSAAAAVAAAISEIRDGCYLKETLPIGGDPVPRAPRPWDGEIPMREKADE